MTYLIGLSNFQTQEQSLLSMTTGAAPRQQPDQNVVVVGGGLPICWNRRRRRGQFGGVGGAARPA